MSLRDKQNKAYSNRNLLDDISYGIGFKDGYQEAITDIESFVKVNPKITPEQLIKLIKQELI